MGACVYGCATRENETSEPNMCVWVAGWLVLCAVRGILFSTLPNQKGDGASNDMAGLHECSVCVALRVDRKQAMHGNKGKLHACRQAWF